jgi:lipopolysaccharide transport system ATP-binding protein
MSASVIKVENVGKQYRLGMVGTGTISHDLRRWWYRVRGWDDPYLKIGDTNDRTKKGKTDLVWALRDINFEVNQGEVLGIIGRNGAGKSTLLKLLSRVTQPTTGGIKVRGRIASLLEVGTGFHPELSGRENIFLNGAILGMTKAEIRSKFDEIVDFSGVERYIDTPVKRYSSGMYVRLAFAVAAHLEPEILIIDEVLAVGDAEFQKKCLGKMKDVSGQGRTVLFVSHNMVAVQNLCSMAMILDNGRLMSIDNTKNVVNQYLSYNIQNDDSVIVDLSKAKRTKGTQRVIRKIWLENSRGETVKNVLMGESFSILYSFESAVVLNNVLFGFGLENSQGERITSLNNEISGDLVPSEIQQGVVRLQIDSPNLMEGQYYVSVSVVCNQIEWVDYIEQAFSFTVVSFDVYGSGKLITSNQGKIFLQAHVYANSETTI